MNNTKNQWMKDHPKTVGMLGILFFIIILSFIFSGDKKEGVKIVDNAIPQTFEEKLQSLNVKSGSTDISYMKVEDQKADSDRPVNFRMIIVSYDIKSFYNKESLLKEKGKLSAKAFKEIYQNNPNNYDAIIWYYSPTVDKYGNATSSIILTNAIDKKTYEKINWSNFDSSNLCEFLRKEASVNDGETTCAILANIK